MFVPRLSDLMYMYYKSFSLSQVAYLSCYLGAIFELKRLDRFPAPVDVVTV